MATKKITENMIWPEWTDELGNTYRPGDIVAVAIVNGRSPQMVLAVVERINKVNSSGDEIRTNKTFDLDEPIRHERECYYLKQKREIEQRVGRPGYYDNYTYERAKAHSCEPSCTEWWQTTEVRNVPSCSVRATPIADLRGFGRSRNHDGKAKTVTYSIPENILFIKEGQ
jgi:hypothetical protein